MFRIFLGFVFILNTYRTVAFHLTAKTRSCRTYGPLPNAHSEFADCSVAYAPSEIELFQRQLASVRALPRLQNNRSLSRTLLCYKPNECPTFRRLFDHETWLRYSGKTAIVRCIEGITMWRTSVILRAVWPVSAVIFCWGLVVQSVLPKSILEAAANQQLPLSLQGSAIGLLLVFHTNSAYRRLEEARKLMSKLVFLSQEASTKIMAAVAWGDSAHGGGGSSISEGSRGDGGSRATVPGLSAATAAALCRYLVAFVWTLRDEYRDGDDRRDILELLLPTAEVAWVTAQRSRSSAVLSLLRRAVRHEGVAERLSATEYLLLEGDVASLGAVASNCERLFTSPIPPTMSRHNTRSLTLWLLALPVVLAGTMPPIINAAWSATTAFIFVGIDELGVQVEQPFRIMPLWELCLLAQANVEESLSVPSFANLDSDSPAPNYCHEWPSLFYRGLPSCVHLSFEGTFRMV